MKIVAGNITIMVKDMDSSISFYQSIGLTLKQRWANHYAQLTAPGITIGLHPANASVATNTNGALSIGFTTDNFEETESELANLNIKTTSRKEEGGNFLHFSDPDGTALYFIKPKWG